MRLKIIVSHDCKFYVLKYTSYWKFLRNGLFTISKIYILQIITLTTRIRFISLMTNFELAHYMLMKSTKIDSFIYVIYLYKNKEECLI